jgi:hypothetical protein
MAGKPRYFSVSVTFIISRFVHIASLSFALAFGLEKILNFDVLTNYPEAQQ